MAIEKIYTANSYEVYGVTWSGYITLIQELGIAQLRVFYRATGATNWIELEKSSYKDTYNSSAKTIDLTNATYLSGGSSVPALLNKAQHEIRLLRDTSQLLYIKFQDGSKLSAKDLNSVNQQALDLTEEEEVARSEADSAIYTYIAEELAKYYLQTEIDSFFRSPEFPAWLTSTAYVEGDMVKHNDPNDDVETVFVWRCVQAHTSTNNKQPTTGSSYWSYVGPSSSLNYIPYIKTLPGLNSSRETYNTIKVSNANAYGLVIEPHSSQAVDVFNIKTTGNLNGLRVSSDDDVYISNMDFYTEGASYLGSGTDGVYINWETGTPTGDTLHVKGNSSDGAFSVWSSAATSTIGTGNLLIKIDDDDFRTYADLRFTSNYTEFSGEAISFAGSTTEDCSGSFAVIGDDKAFTGVRFGRDVSFGTVDNCTSNTYTSRVDIDVSAGDVSIVGDLTAANIEATGNFTTAITSADYLKTDASGNIISGTGTPVLSRSSITVTSSNTVLAEGDVVYLDNDTGLWTKARANNASTLAFGVVDDLTGSDNNQDFNVVVTGGVTASAFSIASDQIGNWVWLSDTTPGGLTLTNPGTTPSTIVDPVGIVIGTNQIYVIPARPHKTSASQSSLTINHGSLTGLSNDDHSIYALADGSRGTFETAGAVASHASSTSGVHGITTYGASLVASADAGTARVTLGSNDAANLTTGTLDNDRLANIPVSKLAGTLDDGQVAESNVTQHATAVAAAVNLGNLGDVAIGLLSSNMFLAYNTTSGSWTGRAPAAARTALGLGTAATSNTTDFAAASHTHTVSDITDLSDPVTSPSMTGVAAGSVTGIIKCTQAQYDAITPVSTILYVIV